MPVDYAARRSAKLAAQQASLPPEERIINRDDWENAIQERVPVLTRLARVRAKKAFIDTAVDPSVGICNTRLEAEAFFQHGGTRFTCKTLRIFLEASALSRDGRIEDVLAARSLLSLACDIFAAALDAGNPVERDVKDDTLLFISGSLIPRGLAHTNTRDKPTPIPRDITSFLQNLFDRSFSVTLTSTRDILLIALCVCLSIDCSSRISELLMPTVPKKELDTYKTQHKDKIFTWSCVEVFAFKDEGEGNVYLMARLTFKDLKRYSKHGIGPKLTKTIPLRLLPPAHVAEDSLFWLMVLGLIDNVFEGVSSWSDIDSLQPGPKGLKIRVKQTMMQVPVFRIAVLGITKSERPENGLISNQQMLASAMRIHLRNLSRFCGLEHAMLPNVLRRGAAYQLALTVSREERCARMGHSSDDPSYWRYYRNTTSTVDFQARRHGIGSKDVEMMSSMFLGTGNGQQPPRWVSEEGMAEVYRDPGLLDLLSKKSDLADELIQQYGTLDNARTLNPDRYRDYRVLYDKHKHELGRLSRKKYDAEYKAYWKTQQPESTELPEHQTPAAGQSELDIILNAQDRESASTSITVEQLVEEEALATAAMSELALSLDEEEADDELDAVQSRQTDELPTTKSHGWFGKRDIARHTLLDELSTYLYEQPPGTTWKLLADYFVTAFNHLHSADRFFPGQQPLPGTFDCRFCGVDMHVSPGPKDAHLHALKCEPERLAQQVLDGLRNGNAKAISTCPILDESAEPCKARLVKAQTYSHHLRIKHLQPDISRFICSDHDPVMRTLSISDMRVHAITAHHASTNVLVSETYRGNFWYTELVYFCPFCQVWIPRPEQLEHDHLNTHMADAVEIISARGMAGLWMNMRFVHPCFCPFCIYDTTLDHAGRLVSFMSRDGILVHITQQHLNKLSGTMPCPATTSTPESLPQCSESKSLTPAEMAIHLQSAHGFDIDVSKVDDSDAVQTKKQEGDGRQKSKRAKTTGRSPLAEMSVNKQTGYNHSGEN